MTQYPIRRAPSFALDVAERDRAEQLALVGGDDGEERSGSPLAERGGELQQRNRVGRPERRRQVGPSLDLEVLTGVVDERDVSRLPRAQRHQPARHLVEADGIALRPLAHESPNANISRLRVIVPVAPHTVRLDLEEAHGPVQVAHAPALLPVHTVTEQLRRRDVEDAVDLRGLA